MCLNTLLHTLKSRQVHTTLPFLCIFLAIANLSFILESLANDLHTPMFFARFIHANSIKMCTFEN